MNNGTANVNTKCFPFIAILAQETCAAAWPYQAYISVKLERIAGRSASPTARVLHSATVSIAHSKKKKKPQLEGLEQIAMLRLKHSVVWYSAEWRSCIYLEALTKTTKNVTS